MPKLRSILGLLTLGAGAWAGEHPVPLEKNIDAAKCLECHEEQSKGKSVHSAIAMGCTSCHEVKGDEKTTLVELNQAKDQLCFTCHAKSEEKVLHGPYASGSCVRCHDPHASDFPKQLRANTNELCLACHGLDQPQVKWQAQTKTVSMLTSQVLSLDEYRTARKIGIDKKHPKAHPLMGHPVSGVDPRGKDKKAEMTCLSCHRAHGSQVEKLMPDGIKGAVDLCGACHQGS